MSDLAPKAIVTLKFAHALFGSMLRVALSASPPVDGLGTAWGTIEEFLWTRRPLVVSPVLKEQWQSVWGSQFRDTCASNNVPGEVQANVAAIVTALLKLQQNPSPPAPSGSGETDVPGEAVRSRERFENSCPRELCSTLAVTAVLPPPDFASVCDDLHFLRVRYNAGIEWLWCCHPDSVEEDSALLRQLASSWPGPFRGPVSGRTALLPETTVATVADVAGPQPA